MACVLSNVSPQMIFSPVTLSIPSGKVHCSFIFAPAGTTLCTFPALELRINGVLPFVAPTTNIDELVVVEGRAVGIMSGVVMAVVVVGVTIGGGVA